MNESKFSEIGSTFSASVWSHLTPPEPEAIGSISQNTKADVVVIGAGILGLSTALHLAEAGVSVVVVEAHALGYGASGRNTGFVVPQLHFPSASNGLNTRLDSTSAARLTELVEKSADSLFDLVSRLDIECSAERSGWLEAAHSARVVPQLEVRARHAADRGRPVNMLSPEETTEMIGTSGYCGGYYDASGGQINPLAYTRGLAMACLDAGAIISVGTPVSKLERVGDRWRIHLLNHDLMVEEVVLATNALGGSLVPEVDSSIQPIVVHQIATQPLSANDDYILPGRVAVSDTRRHAFAVRRSPDNRLITGGLVPVGPARLARCRRQFTRRLANFFPKAAPFSASYTWGGVIAVTPDWLPRLVMVDKGLFAPIGCNGRGVAMTTAFGKALADRLSGAISGEDFPIPEVQPQPFAGRRFASAGLPFWLTWSRLLDWIDSRRPS